MVGFLSSRKIIDAGLCLLLAGSSRGKRGIWGQAKGLGEENENLSLTCRSYKVFFFFWFVFLFLSFPTGEMATHTWLPVFYSEEFPWVALVFSFLLILVASTGGSTPNLTS